MSPYTLAWYERRTERILRSFGLTEPVREPIYRERMLADKRPAHFSPIQREALMVLAELTREVRE